ncbi:MAG: aspartate kinase [Chloroflexi bacterium]|nr:aspartate kinase [Chloroflexota bacterium]
MAFIVQKYGGSSLADAAKIKTVARRIVNARSQAHQVVVVCSAMGDATDQLLQLAHQVSANPQERELDVLLSTGETASCALVAMTLMEIGCPAVSLTGMQTGIRTEGTYGRATIDSIDPTRLLHELGQGKVVVVAGFQGFTRDMDVTTLCRGGSDITAVALAAVLKAERCEVYTDVEGIYTADPRVVPQARKLAEIDYEEMLELAAYGAKMQPRSIELGALYQVPILVASAFNEAPGTLIHREVAMEVRDRVRGVAYDQNVAKITVQGVRDQPGVAAALFEPLAAAGISVDTIVQNASVEKLADLSFTVARSDLQKAMKVVQETAARIGAKEVIHDSRLAKVSIVGTGTQFAPGYAARMFRALANAGINIEMITTSEIRITCIVGQEQAHDAVRALHAAFDLEKDS